MMKWDTHEVSAKAAIYNLDATKVLVMVYAGGRAYGLPGGHLDAGETPIQAMRRELIEEIGTDNFDLEQQEFFIRNDDEQPPRLILGYSGRADESIKLTFVSEDMHGERAIWIDRAALGALEPSIAPGYRAFIDRHWPTPAAN